MKHPRVTRNVTPDVTPNVTPNVTPGVPPTVTLFRVIYLLGFETHATGPFYSCRMMAFLNAWLVSTTYGVATRVLSYEYPLH